MDRRSGSAALERRFGLGETAGSAGRAFSFEWDLVVLAVSSKALSHRISLLTGSLTGKF